MEQAVADNPTGTGPSIQERLAAIMAPPQVADKPVDQSAEAVAADEEQDATEQLAAPDSEGDEVSVEAEGTEAEAAEDDDKHTVRINGEEQKVTYDELIAGYQRQADTTRKAQQVSAQRQEVEALKASLLEKDRQYLTLLPALEELLAKPIGEAPKRQDFKDDTSYLIADRQYRGQVEQVESVRAERQRVQAEHQARMVQQFSEWRAREAESLLAKLPAWKNAETRAAEQSAIWNYAQSQGLRPEELEGLYDHRWTLILADAMRGAKARQKGKAKAKAAPTTKTLQPGAGTDQNALRDKELNGLMEKARQGKTGPLLGKLFFEGR